MEKGGGGERKYIKFCWEKISPQCEWDQCTEYHKSVNSFLYHIQLHLKDHLADDLKCLWRDCNSVLPTSKEFTRHVYFHGFHTKLKCLGENQLHRKNLMKCSLDAAGKNIIPDLPEDFTCYWEDCMTSFENAEFFYQHVNMHADPVDLSIKTKKSRTLCQWQGCTVWCCTHYRLKEHLRSHTQEKVIACPMCGAMFSSRTKLNDHIMRQSSFSSSFSKESTYACVYCKKHMPTARLLKEHMRHHVNNVKCPHCDMTCPSRSALQIHIVYRHTTEKPFACPECEYRTKSEYDLRKHIDTIHPPFSKFECPVENCDFEANSSYSLTKHLAKHENKNDPVYMCHLCQKTFRRGHNLTKHLTSIHQFKWPSGHIRFRYHQDNDGFYRLQTVRYESIELSVKMLQNGGSIVQELGMEDEDSHYEDDDPDDPSPVVRKTPPPTDIYVELEDSAPHDRNDGPSDSTILLQYVNEKNQKMTIYANGSATVSENMPAEL